MGQKKEAKWILPPLSQVLLPNPLLLATAQLLHCCNTMITIDFTTLFLKQILQQDENSQVYKFFQLQLNQPVKGDWVSTCLEDLSQLKINKSLEEIKQISENKFKTLLKTRIKENAFEYLLKRRGSKGQGNHYSTLEMSGGGRCELHYIGGL